MPNALYMERECKGRWRECLNADRPLLLEVGCGRGEFTLGLARAKTGFNVVGMDIKSDRLWKGAKLALEAELKNVWFMREDVVTICNAFGPGDVDELWITFPDPFPKKSQKKNRLTDTIHLYNYKQIVKPGAEFHFKTDNEKLFDYSLDCIKAEGGTFRFITRDLHAEKGAPEVAYIKTNYERDFLAMGRKTHYVQFSFPTK